MMSSGSFPEIVAVKAPGDAIAAGIRGCEIAGEHLFHRAPKRSGTGTLHHSRPQAADRMIYSNLRVVQFRTPQGQRSRIRCLRDVRSVVELRQPRASQALDERRRLPLSGATR